MPHQKPLLLLDVDGVLNPTGNTTPPHYQRHETDEYVVSIHKNHQYWLSQLAHLFELVWATTWGPTANTVFGPLLKLSAMRHVTFQMTTAPTRKLASVASYVADRPTAWIDDELYEDATEWASQRNTPTLLVRTKRTVGLTRPDFHELLLFAHSSISDGCEHDNHGFDNHDLTCARPRCQRAPTASIVSIQPGLNERMKWNIGGTCDKHQDQVTTQSNANLADHPLAGPHIGTADLPKVLKWIHTEGRCALEYITINNPDANHTAKAEDRD